jgi:hypothetical protein
MSADAHSLALEHLPWFITAPGESDLLFTLTTIVVVASVVVFGVLFFWLHSLPERMGHRKLQFEVVAVLGLLALFTHIHAFWVAGLLLALIDLPDIMSPLRRMAAAAETMAGTGGAPPENSDQGPAPQAMEDGHA